MNTKLEVSQVIGALYEFAEREARDGVEIVLPRPYDERFAMDATGMDSLSAAALASYVENRFDIRISFGAFLEARTLGDAVSVVLGRMSRA